jgi:hypothetical protein
VGEEFGLAGASGGCGCGGVPEVLSINSAVTGKAVQTGHSSAAVTHHEPSFRFRAGTQPVGQPAKARGRKHARGVQTPNPKSQTSKWFRGLRPFTISRLDLWSLDFARHASNAESEHLSAETHRAEACACLGDKPSSHLMKRESGYVRPPRSHPVSLRGVPLYGTTKQSSQMDRHGPPCGPRDDERGCGSGQSRRSALAPASADRP